MIVMTLFAAVHLSASGTKRTSLVAPHMSASHIEGQGARRLRGALRGAEVINSLMIEPLENFETWLMIWTAAYVVSFREGGAFK